MTPRILLSNDDGIHAPGLKVLEKIAREISSDVWVVAPEAEQSGAAHSITLTRPLRIRQLSKRRFSVDGTPTDCVALSLLKILKKEKRPTLMLSGVNHGSNLGDDVSYSGTVAAAMEATLLGIPAIALSQSTSNGSHVKWGIAETFAPTIIKQLMSFKWPKGVLMNINFPNIPKESIKGAVIVRHGFRLPTGGELTEWKDPSGRSYYWLLGAIRDDSDISTDTDLHAIKQGYITITPLHLDMTHYDTLHQLSKTMKIKLEGLS